MICTIVKIVPVDQKEPAFPEVVMTLENVVRCNLDRAAILQGGMESGRPSVAFSIDLPDGKIAFVETSYANFEMMASAFKGAAIRWEEGH